MEKRPLPGSPLYADLMRPGERVAEAVYFPIHVAILPMFLPYLGFVFPDLQQVDYNVIYYVIGLVWTLGFCWRFLRAGFDAAMDHFGAFALAVLLAWVLELSLSMIAGSLAAIVIPDFTTAPNNDALISMAPQGYGKLVSMTVFMGPIVEEVLFRGMLFGGLRRRSRVLAWVVSVLIFSLYHVWQYAINDVGQLLYILLYIPGAVALTWCYERSGSIWCPIAYHMLTNAASLAALI